MNDNRLIANWQQVNKQITKACEQANDLVKEQEASTRPASDVTLLAVSKTKPADMIAILAEQGQRDFGENYLQEAVEKIKALQDQPDAVSIVWHYIGHIQRNKTRDIAENFDWVQTLERDIIAKRLNDQRPADMPPLNVLIQLNIDDEESKSGCHPKDLPDLLAAIKDYERLQLRGLMIIPAKSDTDAFKRTKLLFEKVKREYPELKAWDTLSMGMSNDMTAAIGNGSTMVRVGTAIFGARD
ncbi:MULTISPECIES: YggS family pyridoxal phosphate-dependent enzyme [unclassified Psychrobacter]|uniref:YggS family pyridoxal phosphate-dependent enzyme n=1 Tax=unclassified Psychrobacter TaxID=196806 RepID=UPI00071E9263|nr:MULTISPECIES: YggS family pyridoxal phosphate-dependent enzyme [unclassified Psychrobacter]OLF37006.1 YggS family pyridoxal phosphate enzyme [Psychrobacter sp. Cmf 22.2]